MADDCIQSSIVYKLDSVIIQTSDVTKPQPNMLSFFTNYAFEQCSKTYITHYVQNYVDKYCNYATVHITILLV